MKIYTEEQVREAISEARFLNQQVMPNESIIDRLSSIELPSDEEIFQRAIKEMEERYGSNSKVEVDVYFRGAMWMKQQIQGGNK